MLLGRWRWILKKPGAWLWRSETEGAGQWPAHLRPHLRAVSFLSPPQSHFQKATRGGQGFWANAPHRFLNLFSSLTPWIPFPDPRLPDCRKGPREGHQQEKTSHSWLQRVQSAGDSVEVSRVPALPFTIGIMEVGSMTIVNCLLGWRGLWRGAAARLPLAGEGWGRAGESSNLAPGPPPPPPVPTLLRSRSFSSRQMENCLFHCSTLVADSCSATVSRALLSRRVCSSISHFFTLAALWGKAQRWPGGQVLSISTALPLSCP